MNSKKLYLKRVFIGMLLIVIGCDRSNHIDLIMYTDYTTDTRWSTQYECDYHINMTSYLEIDDGGYYHMQFIDNYFQTFTTFTVETGSCGYYKKVRLI